MAKQGRKNVGGVSFDVNADMSQVDNALNALPKRAARSMQDALKALQAALARNKLDMKSVLASNPNDVLNIAVLKQAQDGLKAKIDLVSKSITDQGKAIQDAARQAQAAKQAQADGQNAAKAAAAAAKQAAQDQAKAARDAAAATKQAAREAAAEAKKLNQQQISDAKKLAREQAASARQAARDQAKSAREAAAAVRQATRQQAASAKQAARDQAKAAREAAKALKDAQNEASGAGHRIQIFAQSLDDLQYVPEQGLRPILNNLTQIAPIAAIVGIAAQLLYTHWDKLLNLFGSGKSKVASQAEEMERLASATRKTVEESKKLNQYEKTKDGYDTIRNTTSTDQDEQSSAVEAAIKERGGDAVLDALGGLDAFKKESNVNLDRKAMRKVMQDRLDASSKSAQEIGPVEQAQNIEIDEALKDTKKFEEYFLKFRGALRPEDLKRDASQLREAGKEVAGIELEKAKNDPEALRALLAKIGPEAGKLPAGLFGELENALPENRKAQAEIDAAGEAQSAKLKEEAKTRDEGLKASFDSLKSGLERGMRERGEFATTEAAVQASLDRMGGVSEPGWSKKLTEELNTSGSRELAAKALEMGVSQPEAQGRIEADIKAKAAEKARQDKEQFDQSTLDAAGKAAPGLGDYLSKVFTEGMAQGIDPSMMRDELSNQAVGRMVAGGMGDDQARRAAQLMLAEAENEGREAYATGGVERKAFQSERIDLETLGTRLLTGSGQDDPGKQQVEWLTKVFGKTEEQVRLLRQIASGTPATLG